MAIDKSMRVLIVDDYDSILDALQRALKFMGFTNLARANSAEQALTLLQAEPQAYTLVISDFQMGAKSGLDLRRSMREDPALAEIKFILMTGTPPSALQLQEAGVDSMMPKPFRTRQLGEELARLFP